MKVRKGVIAVALLAAPVAVGVGAATMTHRGPMAVDQQALDVFNASVDEQVVDYYDSVCHQVAATQDIAAHFVTTAQDTIGLDVEEAGAMWQERLSQVADRLGQATAKVTTVEEAAPEKVLRPDDAPEDRDYRGALIPMTQVLQEGQERARSLVGDPRWSDLDTATQQEITGEALRVVGSIPGDVSVAMKHVVENAPVFSEATKKRVESGSSCGQFFHGEHVEEDVVLGEVVQAYQVVRSAHERFGEAMEKVTGLESLTGEDLVAARSEIAQTWGLVAEIAEGNQKELDQWNNTQEVGTPEWKAVQRVQVLVEEVASVYHDVGLWAREQERVSEQAELSIAGLQGVLNAAVEGLRDQQIAEARSVTKALTTMPVPNEATRIALEEKGEGDE